MRPTQRYQRAKILFLHQVCQRLGMTADEIFYLIRQGRFPARTVISDRLSGWPEDAIHDWALKQLERQARRRGA